MNYKHGPDVKQAVEGEMPFVVSMSKMLRLTVSMGGQYYKDKIEGMGKDIAHQFENDPVLKNSLKNDPQVLEGKLVMRQIDLKDAEGDIIVKAFVMWNLKIDCWHVLLELPNEDVWETGKGNA